MHFDLRGDDKANAYKLLASVVVPRPIALVTTLGPDGVINAAPFSFFNLLNGAPPVVALGIGDRDSGEPKDTFANIELQEDFVVNLVTEDIATRMNICAIDFPFGMSELDKADLTPVASHVVKAPRIAESRVQLECVLLQFVPIPNRRLVLGEVVGLHIDDEFVDRERAHVHTENLGLIGRMHGGGWYVRTTDLFEMPRKTYSQWLAEQ